MDIRLVTDNTCQCGRTIISRASHAVCPYCGHATALNYSRSVGVPVVLNTQKRVVFTQPRARRYIITDEY